MLQIFFAFKCKQIATDTCMLLQLAGARAPAGSPEGAAGPVPGEETGRTCWARPQLPPSNARPIRAANGKSLSCKPDSILSSLQHIK